MSKFINPDEVLLMWNTTHTGDPYISDSTNLGKSYTLDMLLDEPGEKCTRIMVLNMTTMRASDITEPFAAAWLALADKSDELEVDADYTADDLEKKFPAYVRNSMAWKRLKDDLEAERPVENVDTYNALRRDYSTIPAITTARRPDMSRKSRAEAV